MDMNIVPMGDTVTKVVHSNRHCEILQLLLQ